jgi:hypothetical protein
MTRLHPTNMVDDNNYPSNRTFVEVDGLQVEFDNSNRVVNMLDVDRNMLDPRLESQAISHHF